MGKEKRRYCGPPQTSCQWIYSNNFHPMILRSQEFIFPRLGLDPKKYRWASWKCEEPDPLQKEETTYIIEDPLAGKKTSIIVRCKNQFRSQTVLFLESVVDGCYLVVAFYTIEPKTFHIPHTRIKLQPYKTHYLNTCLFVRAPHFCLLRRENPSDDASFCKNPVPNRECNRVVEFLIKNLPWWLYPRE